MQVLTHKTFFGLIKNGDREFACAADKAVRAINVATINWGNMHASECEQHAHNLRVLADMLDGRETAGKRPPLKINA